MGNEQFRISSHLKNHIGKDLITDNVIAIFELVKNSYDAEASHVSIEFKENEIIIVDDGYGMSMEDIKNKWLFVGYSSKVEKDKNGDIIENKNKRRNLKRHYAGAKGVGRFACDRLGSMLTLYSKKEGGNESKLIIPRDKFEKNMNKEFGSINVTLEKSNDKNIGKQGTLLIISNLREGKWAREDILKLKKQLMRLISPVKNNQEDIFSIEIIDKNNEKLDRKDQPNRENVNGLIINDTLEKIINYTVYITAEIYHNSLSIKIYDRGRYVFGLKKHNKKYDKISDVQMQLYFLNTTAKREFSKMMGIDNVSYGSIFLFKNDIRVYPFGETDNDKLGLDQRKTQGYARFLGTRDLLGYVNIIDEKDDFKEKTSRDGGFIENESYRQLVEFILEEGVKKLEKYVVDALSWTESRQNKEIFNIENRLDDVKSFIKKQLSEEYSEIEIGQDFKNILNEKNILESFKEKVKGSHFEKDFNAIEKIVKQTSEQNKELEKETGIQKQQIKLEKQKMAVLERQNEFLQDTQNISKEKILGNIHDIGIINDDLDVLLSEIHKKAGNKRGIEDLLSLSFFYINKIRTITKFAHNSDYITNKGAYKNGNICKFMHEWGQYLSSSGGISLKYSDNFKESECPTVKFSEVNINTILLNLFSNSKKALAREIKIIFKTSKNELLMYFHDNGKGIDSSIKSNIFNLGVTTSNGSGIGLYVVKRIMHEDFNGNIETIESDDNNGGLGGASFLLIFPLKQGN